MTATSLKFSNKLHFSVSLPPVLFTPKVPFLTGGGLALGFFALSALR
jgi:hypothetical protein